MKKSLIDYKPMGQVVSTLSVLVGMCLLSAPSGHATAGERRVLPADGLEVVKVYIAAEAPESVTEATVWDLSGAACLDRENYRFKVYGDTLIAAIREDTDRLWYVVRGDSVVNVGRENRLEYVKQYPGTLYGRLGAGDGAYWATDTLVYGTWDAEPAQTMIDCGYESQPGGSIVFDTGERVDSCRMVTVARTNMMTVGEQPVEVRVVERFWYADGYPLPVVMESAATVNGREDSRLATLAIIPPSSQGKEDASSGERRLRDTKASRGSDRRAGSLGEADDITAVGMHTPDFAINRVDGNVIEVTFTGDSGQAPTAAQPCAVLLCNAAGQVFFTAEGSCRIALDTLPRGVYLLAVSRGDDTTVVKIAV